MKIRATVTLDAERIDTDEQVLIAHNLLHVALGSRAPALGDFIITKPSGERFVWLGETFEATYEVLERSSG